MYHLTFPNISHKSRYREMIEEWKNFETPDAPNALFQWSNFEEFLKITEDNMHVPSWVPATLFFFMEDDEILWAIQISHHINNPMLSLEWSCVGHMGYGLRPSARGKWLAKIMLALGLTEAKKLWIDDIIISANEDNIASWKTIESCGGKYIKTIDQDGKDLKVYSIYVS